MRELRYRYRGCKGLTPGRYNATLKSVEGDVVSEEYVILDITVDPQPPEEHHMEVTLILYREHPGSLRKQDIPLKAAALRVLDSRDPGVGAFLTEAVERVTDGIRPGEVREVGVGIKVVG